MKVNKTQHNQQGKRRPCKVHSIDDLISMKASEQILKQDIQDATEQNIVELVRNNMVTVSFNRNFARDVEDKMNEFDSSSKAVFSKAV